MPWSGTSLLQDLRMCCSTTCPASATPSAFSSSSLVLENADSRIGFGQSLCGSQRAFHEAPGRSKLGGHLYPLVSRAVDEAIALVKAVCRFHEERAVQHGISIAECLRICKKALKHLLAQSP